MKMEKAIPFASIAIKGTKSGVAAIAMDNFNIGLFQTHDKQHLFCFLCWL